MWFAVVDVVVVAVVVVLLPFFWPLHPGKIVELLAAWAAFLMHGELAILCKRHMHNYGLAVYSVCGHACSSHWSHTSPLHDRTKTANGSCSSENPPRNSGMRPGLTVRRSTSDSTLSRPTVAFFSPSKQAKSRTIQIYQYIYNIQYALQLCMHHTSTVLRCFLWRIHRTARTALRHRAGFRSCMLPASCGPCSACASPEASSICTPII